MKFGEIFEYHKIPEWYNMYLNYELFKQKIELSSMKKKFDEVMMHLRRIEDKLDNKADR